MPHVAALAVPDVWPVGALRRTTRGTQDHARCRAAGLGWRRPKSSGRIRRRRPRQHRPAREPAPDSAPQREPNAASLSTMYAPGVGAPARRRLLTAPAQALPAVAPRRPPPSVAPSRPPRRRPAYAAGPSSTLERSIRPASSQSRSDIRPGCSSRSRSMSAW